MTAAKHPPSQPAPSPSRPRAAADPRAARAGARFKRQVRPLGPAAAAAYRTPMEALKLKDELQRLEAAWQVEQERISDEGRWDRGHLPTSGRVVLTVVLAIAIVFVLAFGETTEGETGVLATPTGLIMLVYMYFVCTDIYTKSIAYHQALKAYQRRRAELLAGDLELSEDWQGMDGADWIPGWIPGQPSAEI